MADIVERLIELISATEPLEEKVSEAVAGFLERTAGKISRLESVSGEDVPSDLSGGNDPQPA